MLSGLLIFFPSANTNLLFSLYFVSFTLGIVLSVSDYVFGPCFKFMYFNWRLITLQYCTGFAIHSQESAMGAQLFKIIQIGGLNLLPYN